MLRALVLALLAANLAWFAWAQGWLEGWLPAPGDADQREPHRLQAQVRPQVVTVTPLRGATSPVDAPPAAPRSPAPAGETPPAPPPAASAAQPWNEPVPAAADDAPDAAPAAATADDARGPSGTAEDQSRDDRTRRNVDTATPSASSQPAPSAPPPRLP